MPSFSRVLGAAAHPQEAFVEDDDVEGTAATGLVLALDGEHRRVARLAHLRLLRCDRRRLDLQRLDDVLTDLNGAVGRRCPGRSHQHGDARVRLEEAEEPGDAIVPAGASVIGTIAAPQPAERTAATPLVFPNKRGLCRGLRVATHNPRHDKADCECAGEVPGEVGHQVLHDVFLPDVWPAPMYGSPSSRQRVANESPDADAEAWFVSLTRRYIKS